MGDEVGPLGEIQARLPDPADHMVFFPAHLHHAMGQQHRMGRGNPVGVDAHLFQLLDQSRTQGRAARGRAIP